MVKSMSNDSEKVKFIIRIIPYSSAELFSKRDRIGEQFDLSFGASYYSLFIQSLGVSFSIAMVVPTAAQDQLAAIFPFSHLNEIKQHWASSIRSFSEEWANKLIDRRDIVVMDFSSVSPVWRGYAPSCFKSVGNTLYHNGYSIGITEVQWLRQAILWLRNGWKPVAPIDQNLKMLYLNISNSIKDQKSPQPWLEEGQEFIWHHESFYEGLQWNVVLQKPLYLYYEFKTDSP